MDDIFALPWHIHHTEPDVIYCKVGPTCQRVIGNLVHGSRLASHIVVTHNDFVRMTEGKTVRECAQCGCANTNHSH
jgi:hypothetical protein